MSAVQLEWKPAGTTAEIEPLFQTLARRWRDETGYYSFAHQYAMHPAYLRIIGLGPPVVPLILAEMRDRPGQWFIALEAITGVNPYTLARERGFVKINVPEATAAWLNWGRQNGLIG